MKNGNEKELNFEYGIENILINMQILNINPLEKNLKKG